MPYRPRGLTGRSPTVAAVLLPRERSRVEAAGSGYFDVVQRDSIPEAIQAVRERGADAFLVSVAGFHGQRHAAQAVGHLVRQFPSIPTVALLSAHDPTASDTLLQLGANGVQQVVDVTVPDGWSRLRSLLGPRASRAVARIQGPTLAHLRGANAEARFFLQTLIQLAPTTPTVRSLAGKLEVKPSTLMSRFGRSGLPSPKSYLASVRLLHAAHLFESTGLSVADVAYQLEYSSPQSFGRHLRTMLGITASEYRRRFTLEAAVERFLGVMIRPYRSTWLSFRPLAGSGRRRG